MRGFALMAFVLLLLPPWASAGDDTEKVSLIKPVQAWEGRLDSFTPATHKSTVLLIADAEGFEAPWRILRGDEKVPAIDFKKHFVVLVLYGGNQFSLEGLALDERGSAKVRGSGYVAPVNAPRGRAYALAVFPRDKVKSVDGRDVPAPR